MKHTIDNPNKLSEKEQARRYRRIHRKIWTEVREVLDGNHTLDYIARRIATLAIDELLGSITRDFLDPELAWDFNLKRKGYTITAEPKEGRIENIGWGDANRP